MMSGEIFARFLAYLDPNQERAGQQYNLLHTKLIAAARLAGLSDEEKMADETLDRAAKRIAGGADVPRNKLESYCRGILRHIRQEQQERDRRESNAWQEFLNSICDDMSENIKRVQLLLKPCFEKLAAPEQSLLTDYCLIAHGREKTQKRRELAQKLNLGEPTLRTHIHRLRQKLVRCVKERAQKL